jgi:hypothetical protein
LPVIVNTLSSVLIAVTKRPISLTVPVMPAAVTNRRLKWTQHDHERPGGGVANSRSGHADGDAGGGEDRGEAGGLDPKVTQDRDDQDDVQRDEMTVPI